MARQTADGGWMSQPVEQVAEGALGLVSASITDAPLTKALNYIAEHGPADATRASQTARVILAVVAAGKNPRDFGKVDYVGRLRTYYNPTNGNYDPSTDPNSLSILALAAAKDPIPGHAIGSLQDRQCSDGGFPRAACLLGSDVTSTSLVLEALTAAGVGPSDPVYGKARGYLATAQNADGGFGPGAGQATEAVPTATGLSAIAVMGESPESLPWRKSPNADPVLALLALQDTTTGGFRPDASTTAPDDLTTARALPGLAGRALPLRPSPPKPATTTTQGAVATSTTLGQPIRGATVPRSRTTRTTKPAVEETTTTQPDVTLAAPANRGDSGRSLIGLLPFVATLFGAGAVGVVLRRRART